MIIAAVDHNSLADVSIATIRVTSSVKRLMAHTGSLLFPFYWLQLGGMKEGDFIVGIGDKDVKWASHEQVVRLIKQSGDFINLKLVTPMDRNYLKVNAKIKDRRTPEKWRLLAS